MNEKKFHPARWSARQSSGKSSIGEYAKVCIVCGQEIGERTYRMMLNEIVLVTAADGCCEVRDEPK